MYGRAPSLQHPRIIGCLCFAKVLVRGDKFGARAIGVVHMGYSSSQKGYKLYDLLTNSFFVSRDVKLMENIFPFQLLKEGKLQIFPNGVIESVPSNDTTPSSPSSFTADPPQEASQQIGDTFSKAVFPSNSDNQPRKSSRTVEEPAWMQDYVCNGSQVSSAPQTFCKYPMQDFLYHDGVSVKYKTYLSKITSLKEPNSYEEAAGDPKWVEAMTQELSALKENGT
ncbi:PREDICTED: uncharacterized protein LOC109213403 [Nicotiana attenuata]|uniref:uncharacterized protein LOC109213403 n=1 Tax=Nicotiana attenuata TaxID=49451 RepID=UPI0009055239|nr:PREDICTED: uncharacterized protein LOC109213403 [Nicotiana attenuata]